MMSMDSEEVGGIFGSDKPPSPAIDKSLNLCIPYCELDMGEVLFYSFLNVFQRQL